jgi:hypothetical protein
MTKKITVFQALIAGAGICLFQGCSEKPEQPPEIPAAPTAGSPLQDVSGIPNQTEQVSVTNTTRVVAASPVKAELPPSPALTNSADAANAVASPVVQLLQQAKTLVANGNYVEAASLLSSIRTSDLTTDQTTLWQSLQAQVQKAIAAETAKSATDSVAKRIGGLLQK